MMMKYFPLLCLLLLVSCAPLTGREAPVSITLDEPFVLAVGQEGRLESAGLTIELLEIVRDNRCPREVQCVVAGEAELAIQAWLTGTTPTRFEMNSNPMLQKDMISLDDYDIRLVDIQPAPESPGKTLPMKEYAVTFVVSQKSE